MDISTILSLIITLFFIYFIVSLVASTLLELYAAKKNLRAQELHKWVESTFGPDIKSKLLNHTLIDCLTRKGRTASYIPNEIFSRVFLDVINANVNGNNKLTYSSDEIIAAIQSDKSGLPNEFKKYVLQYAQERSSSIEDLRKGIEEWYTNAMVRISGTYKVLSQRRMFAISLVTVFLFNVDTAQIVKNLASHPVKAAEMAENAIAQLNAIDESKIEDLGEWQDNLSELNEISKTALKDYSTAGLVVDWRSDPLIAGTIMADKPFLVVMKFIGLFISALAGSMGAPFWYELINKIASIKSVGKKPIPVAVADGKEETKK